MRKQGLVYFGFHTDVAVYRFCKRFGRFCTAGGNDELTRSSAGTTSV